MMGNLWNNCGGLMPYGMMGWGYGGGGIFGLIFSVLWLVLIVFAIVWFAKWLSGQGKTWKQTEKSAMDILKERYARGEITKAEYEEMRKEIEK